MKVLFQSREDLFRNPGGDTVQLLKTKEYLEKLGISIDVSLDPEAELRGYDLIHLFDNSRVYRHLKNAKDRGKVVALSPIYWDVGEMDRERFAESTVKRWARRLLSLNNLFSAKLYNYLLRKGKVSEGYRENDLIEKQRYVLENADLLLPNSTAEMDLIQKEFQVTTAYRIIPNAVEPIFRDAKPDHFISSYRVHDFILCVGRIEFRKNQLRLLQALRDISTPIVFIGHQPDWSYYRRCRNVAQGNALFLGGIQQSELPSAYSAAKVYAQPSWFETPGLSCLEAAAAGCNLVVTSRGSTREYFGEYAWYCEPNNPHSIREAVLEALSKTKDRELSNYIQQNYTWESAAKKTLSAYELCLYKARKG
jgi:glycosyltransferase involved in cell wall biosynthesis